MYIEFMFILNACTVPLLKRHYLYLLRNTQSLSLSRNKGEPSYLVQDKQIRVAPELSKHIGHTAPGQYGKLSQTRPTVSGQGGLVHRPDSLGSKALWKERVENETLGCRSLRHLMVAVQ